MSQITQEALQERPSQEQSIILLPKTKETLAFDALTRAFGKSGLAACKNPLLGYHQYKEVLRNCLDALREAGLLPKSLSEVVSPIDPKATATASVCIFGEYLSAKRTFAPRSHAQAEAIARAIQAEYGGKLKDCPAEAPGRSSTYDVVSDAPEDLVRYVEHSVYYTLDEEDTPHGTTTT